MQHKITDKLLALMWHVCMLYTHTHTHTNSHTRCVAADAVKIHPHLSSRPDELVLTFMSNAFNMSLLFEGASEVAIYIPQTIRASLTRRRSYDDGRGSIIV